MTQHAPALSFDELQKEMGLDGLGLGGVLASVGFAERAGFGRPYVANRATREYEMDPAVAKVVADEIQRVRGAGRRRKAPSGD